jgi:two-component system osmolarity sensor histidine kinase EnvZ
MVAAYGWGMRLLFALLALLTIAQFVIVGGSAWLRLHDVDVPRRPGMIDSTAAAVTLLETIDTERRKRLLRAMSSPLVRYRLVAQFPPRNPHPEADRVPPQLTRAWRNALGNRRFHVWAHAPMRHARRAGGRHRGPPRPHLLVMVELSDGSAMLAEGTPLHRRQLALSATVLVSSLIGLVLLAGLAFVTVSTSRPLGDMARRIGEFAGNLNAAPMAERGPTPVRRLARAFNAMQQDLRRLVDQRTMTLAAIAHDFRTYLTRLRLRAEFIADPTQQAKAVRDIDEMSMLMDDTLLLIQQPDGARSTEDDHSASDLVTLLEELVDPHRQADAKISLAGTTRPVPVSADRATLKRALGNLIDNALRYGGAAHVDLTVDDATASVSIRDDGDGVPPQALERLAEPFYRLEASRSRETGGAGLGLAITRALTESLGGRLTLRNAAQGGLEAILSLPRAPASTDR